MRQFAASGFRIWNLGREAKVLYTAFSLLVLVGIGSSALYYADLVGAGLSGIRGYYAGEEPTGAPGSGEVGPDRTVAGPILELPDERGEKLLVAVTYRKLLEVTHFHLFTMPVVLLIVGHLFLATGLRERTKLVWIGLATSSVVLHLATPWLVRYGGGGLAALHALSGAAMAITMTVVAGYPVVAMWRRPPAAS